jgi:transposase
VLNYDLTLSQLVELKLRHTLCKKRNEADRIKAVYLLGKGWSMAEIVEALLLEDDIIRRYFMEYKTKGIEGLLKNNHLGKMSYLTK